MRRLEWPSVSHVLHDMRMQRNWILWRDLLHIEDGVPRVHGGLVLGGFTNQTFLLVEGDVRGSSEATLLVGNDLDIVTLVGGNARVGGTCPAASSG